MLWGVGSGRCGTRSLAADLGGVHEPKPWLGTEATAARYGDAAAREACRERLRQHLARGVPVVDLHLSYIIELVCEVDPDASFIWLARHPMRCVASFLSGNAWTKPNAWRTLWYPRGGWPVDMPRLEKAAHYWRQVNLLIERDLYACGRPWKLRFTEDLQAHENRYPASQDYRYTADEAALVMDICGETWRRLQALR